MSDNLNKSQKIAKNTLVLYFRMLFLMFISFYTSRVILEALGVSDYGIYNVVGGFVSMFALISAALTSACTRFLNFEMGKNDMDRLSVVFSTSVTIEFILAIIIAILCESFGIWYINNVMVIPPERLTAANWCFQLSVVNFCTNLITVPYNAAIVAHEKMKAFAYVSIFEGLSKLGICFLIMVQPFDRLVVYALLLLLVQLVVRTVYQYYCIHNFEECHYKFVIDKPLLQKMFGYSGWHIIGNSSAVLKMQGVDLVLNYFFGPCLNAAKGISNQINSAICGFASNFMMALNPQITQSYARNDLNYMLNLVYKGSRYSFYMLLLLSLPIIINADYILHLWLKTVPEYAVPFAQITLFSSMVTALSNPLITAQNATGNVRNYQIVVGGIQLLNIPLSFLGLWLGYSPITVIVVALSIELLSLVARLVMIPFYIREFKAADYIKKVVCRCFALLGISAIIPVALLMYLPENFATFIVNVIITFLTTLLILFVFGCDKGERKMLVNKVNKMIKLKK